MQYLFSWDEIPGKDDNRFIDFLIQNFDVKWVKTAKINKTDDGKAINISSENNYLSLRLSDERTRATLSIDFVRTDEFIVKSENGKLNLYKMQKDLEYLYSLRNYLIAIVGVFIISLIIGLAISVKNPGLAENYLDSFEKSFSWIKTFPPIAILFLIFLNNAFKSFLALILGIGFGIVPLLFVASNGVILSMLASVVSKQQGTLFVVAAILPHGIVEVPMVLISSGIGLRLGHVIYLSLTGTKLDIKSELMQGISFFIRWVVPLLLVAAIIETIVTPSVVYWLFPEKIGGIMNV